MTIAVHIKVPSKDTGSFTAFNYGCFSMLASHHPEHHFIFISDSPFPEQAIQQKNITPVYLGPAIKNRLLRYYWYNFKLPRVLNRFSADHFVCAGIECSIRTEVPQHIMLHDLSFLNKNKLQDRPEAAYLRRNFKKFVNLAGSVMVTNEFSGNKLAELLPGIEQKIKLIHLPVTHPAVIHTDLEIQSFKEKFTGGSEYFLAFITAASRKNIMMLLKAFSLFKKRQLSNMQLVLLMPGNDGQETVPDFNTYKYREQVKIISSDNAAQLSLYIGGAYAAIYLPEQEICEPEILQAVTNHLPLITTDNAFGRSAFGDAALYCTNDTQQVADQLMLLYKDENRRNMLKRLQQRLAADHSFEHAAEKLWQVLTSADETA